MSLQYLKSPAAGSNSCGFTAGSLMALVARTNVALQVLRAWQPLPHSNPSGVAPLACRAKFQITLPRMNRLVSEATVEGRSVHRWQPASPWSMLQKGSGPRTYKC